jgi:aminopeptidase-like protein
MLNDKSDEIKNDITNLFNKGTEDPIPSKKKVSKKQDKSVAQPKPQVNKKDEKEAVAWALEEMEALRVKFLDFQEEVSELAVLPYLYESLEEFANACMDMIDLIENNVKPENLNQAGQNYYNKMQIFRKELLDSVTRKHKGSDNLG